VDAWSDIHSSFLIDRVSGTAWCASQVLAGDEVRVEHLTLPLPESWGWCVVGSSWLILELVLTLEGRADLGKVLAGIQVPPGDDDAFGTFLEQLGYAYVEESNNFVYKRYLRR
jgi:hypothetical protein